MTNIYVISVRCKAIPDLLLSPLGVLESNIPATAEIQGHLL